MRIVFSKHAIEQLKRRGISKTKVMDCVKSVKEASTTYRGRELRWKSVGSKILEVVTKTEGPEIIVITAYYLEGAHEN